MQFYHAVIAILASDIKVAGHNQTEKSHFISDLFMILMVKYQVY